MSVYFPAFADTYCVCAWMDGQAELTWLVDYILRWFTDPRIVLISGNIPLHRATMLIEICALALSPQL